jgi:hypothetical protein
MWKILLGALLMLTGVVLQICAFFAWSWNNDHAALGFILFASLSLGYGMMFINWAARTRR